VDEKTAPLYFKVCDDQILMFCWPCISVYLS